MFSMPPEIVLIVCQVLLGPADHNTAYTGYRPSEFYTKGGVMHCKRIEMQLYDPAVDQGADPQPFTQNICNREIMRHGAEYDARRAAREKGLPEGAKGWRFWRGGCPVPTVDTATGKILSWSLPPCGHWGKVICDQDTAI